MQCLWAGSLEFLPSIPFWKSLIYKKIPWKMDLVGSIRFHIIEYKLRDRYIIYDKIENNKDMK